MTREDLAKGEIPHVARRRYSSRFFSKHAGSRGLKVIRIGADQISDSSLSQLLGIDAKRRGDCLEALDLGGIQFYGDFHARIIPLTRALAAPAPQGPFLQRRTPAFSGPR